MDPVWAGVTEKWPFLCSAEKCFFGQKYILTQITPKISEEANIYFGKGLDYRKWKEFS